MRSLSFKALMFCCLMATACQGLCAPVGNYPLFEDMQEMTADMPELRPDMKDSGSSEMDLDKAELVDLDMFEPAEMSKDLGPDLEMHDSAPDLPPPLDLSLFARWYFDFKPAQVYQDEANSKPVVKQGDRVAGMRDVLNGGFNMKVSGGATYNILEGVQLSGAGLITTEAKPITKNERTVWAIARVSRDHTGYLISCDSGSNGWSLRVDTGRQLEAFHEGTAGASKPIVTNLINAFELGEPFLVLWHQSASGGSLRVNGAEIAQLSGTDDALGQEAVHSVGSTPSGGSPFDGTIFHVGEAAGLTNEQVMTLEGALLGELAKIKSVVLRADVKRGWTFQRFSETNGIVRVSGGYLGPLAAVPQETVEARWGGGAWRAATLSQDRWSIQIPGTVGSSDLEVRALGGAVSTSIQDISIGDVYLVDGQSNALGALGSTTPPLSYMAPPAGYIFSPHDVPALDPPVTSMKGQWPAFIEHMTKTKTTVPIFVHITGRGSTKLDQFLSTSVEPAAANTQDNLFKRAYASWVRGAGFDPSSYDPNIDPPIAKAIIFLQGETDADQLVADYAQATDRYEASLRALLTSRQSQLKLPTYISILQELDPSYATAEALAAVRTAQRRVRGEVQNISKHPAALSGPDLTGVTFDGVNGVHPNSQMSAADFGVRIAQAILMAEGVL